MSWVHYRDPFEDSISKRETVFQQRYNSKVLIIYSILSKAEEIDKALMALKLWDRLHMRYVLFKGTSVNDRLGTLYTNNIININSKAKYKVLEDVPFNQIIIVDRRRMWMKDYPLSLKEGSNYLFLSAEKRLGKYSSNILVNIAPR